MKQRDWPVFIAAADRVDEACFVVAGDGPLREELAAMAQLAAAPGWAPERMLHGYREAYRAAQAGEPRWA